MKYPVVLTIVASLALFSFSQRPSNSSAGAGCGLTSAQSPEIRGIRLGMNAQQLLSLFPEDGNRQRITDALKDSKRIDKYGVGRFDLRADKETANPRWTGLNYITVELLDERVTSFHISYAGPEWESVDQFVAKLSDALQLPNSSWEPVGEWQKLLRCDGFVVDVYTTRDSAESWVLVQDTSAHRLVEDRRKTAKEKERQVFKP